MAWALVGLAVTGVGGACRLSEATPLSPAASLRRAQRGMLAPLYSYKAIPFPEK